MFSKIDSNHRRLLKILRLPGYFFYVETSGSSTVLCLTYTKNVTPNRSVIHWKSANNARVGASIILDEKLIILGYTRALFINGLL